MNEEEIEELKEFTIDLTDIDEIALGLEICSKKSNMVIQEFADTIIQLQQENKKLKEVIDKAIELNKQVIKDTKEFYRPTKDIIYSGDTLIDIAEQNLDILKEVE